MKFKVLGLVFAMLLSSVVVAEDEAKPKKKNRDAAKNNVAANIIKQLKGIELTDEQKTKLQAIAKETQAEMKKINDEAGITPELIKKRAEVMKSMKDSGKKPAELREAVNKEAGFTEAHAEAFKKTNEARMGLMKKAIALLTDDQKAKLPERLARFTKESGNKKGAKKGKGKKKEAAADAS